jgi:hypothetical protein
VWTVGLGEALFFDGAAGGAAAVFDSVLEAADAPLADGRERVLDWWATAVDQDARPRGDADRQQAFRAMRARMREELGRRPASATAAYWLVAAARGQGDLQGAWDAALAAWVRAPLGADHGGRLRDDLDALVLRAVIPERARAIGQPVDTLREEWAQFKLTWRARTAE